MYYLVTADTDLTAGKGKRLVAWHFRCTVAAGVINLRNGSVTGDIVIPIAIPIDGSSGQSYHTPEGGIVFPAGLFVDVVSGTIVGSVELA